MFDSLRSHGLYSPWNSPGQDTEVGKLSLLQGIFPTQGLNPGLPHCRQILYQLSYKENEWVAITFSGKSSWPRYQTGISYTGTWVLFCWASKEALHRSHIYLLWFWHAHSRVNFVPYKDDLFGKNCSTGQRRGKLLKQVDFPLVSHLLPLFSLTMTKAIYQYLKGEIALSQELKRELYIFIGTMCMYQYLCKMKCEQDDMTDFLRKISDLCLWPSFPVCLFICKTLTLWPCQHFLLNPCTQKRLLSIDS